MEAIRDLSRNRRAIRSVANSTLKLCKGGLNILKRVPFGLGTVVQKVEYGIVELVENHPNVSRLGEGILHRGNEITCRVLDWVDARIPLANVYLACIRFIGENIVAKLMDFASNRLPNTELEDHEINGANETSIANASSTLEDDVPSRPVEESENSAQTHGFATNRNVTDRNTRDEITMNDQNTAEGTQEENSGVISSNDQIASNADSLQDETGRIDTKDENVAIKDTNTITAEKNEVKYNENMSNHANKINENTTNKDNENLKEVNGKDEISSETADELSINKEIDENCSKNINPSETVTFSTTNATETFKNKLCAPHFLMHEDSKDKIPNTETVLPTSPKLNLIEDKQSSTKEDLRSRLNRNRKVKISTDSNSQSDSTGIENSENESFSTPNKEKGLENSLLLPASTSKLRNSASFLPVKSTIAKFETIHHSSIQPMDLRAYLKIKKTKNEPVSETNSNSNSETSTQMTSSPAEARLSAFSPERLSLPLPDAQSPRTYSFQNSNFVHNQSPHFSPNAPLLPTPHFTNPEYYFPTNNAGSKKVYAKRPHGY